ncbi:hypothetical protein Cpir12675_003473 [Ceratocystis pirilliformis]|uniref:Choline transporter-like protein ctl1 n=1 Tax=Ceratocystis pirilliformis TaxID=259994 RepID=A0ABR3Z2Q3_9PEZI
MYVIDEPVCTYQNTKTKIETPYIHNMTNNLSYLYASKFLAQSQAKASTFVGQENAEAGPSSRPGADVGQQPSRPSMNSRAFLSPYRTTAAPYQQTGGNIASSRFGPLAFGSRLAQQQEAPLFHSHYNDFREEDDDDDDDDDDRGRDAADLYALQRSRRVAAASKLAESMGSEAETSNISLDHSRGGYSSFADENNESSELAPAFQSSFPKGLRSSWHGNRRNTLPKQTKQHGAIDEESEHRTSDTEAPSSKGGMATVGLDSELIHDDDPPASLMGEGDDLLDSSPAPFQVFNDAHGREPHNHAAFRQQPIFGESEIDESRIQDVVVLSSPTEPELFSHDSFFAWLYLIMLASMVSTYFLVWLHTSTPDSSHPIGDTIYTTLESSMYMLGVDTVVAIMVALIWLAALQSFVRPMVIIIMVGMPMMSVSFFLYPFISSFHGRGGAQERAMRWASAVPLAAAAAWVYCVYKGRHSIRQAIEILEFSSRILHINSALVSVGLTSLVAIVVWTWLWLTMFARIFLDGHMSTTKSQWIMEGSTWWLGAWFIFMYMWTVSVINEVHRATSAATVSQWYFHRNAIPMTPSQEVVKAAINHAFTTIFGTISLATLLARMIRMPILFLPARMSFVIQRIANMIMPTSVVALTNPLTVTYAGIHSQNLTTSARGLSSMEFLGPQTPTATLTPRVFNTPTDDPRHSGLVPYRLAKMLLYASRFVMAVAMGFAGWVVTSRQLAIEKPDGSGVIRGSLYAYTVGLVASFIGYSVMGSMESVLGNIMDAVVVCYGSERRMQNGVGAYCMEAAYLLGGRRRADDEAYA